MWTTCSWDTGVVVATERGGLPLDTLHRIQTGAADGFGHNGVGVAPRLASRPARIKAAFQGAVYRGFTRRAWVLPFDLAVAREHARIWADLAERGETIDPYDLIIAATAIAYKSPLATLNFKEFQKIEGLEVLALSSAPTPRGRRGKPRGNE